MQFNASSQQAESWIDMVNLSSIFKPNHHLEDHHESCAFEYSNQESATNAFYNQTTGCTINQNATNTDLYGFVSASIWHVVSKLPYLFYLVWPTETMFAELGQVPRYVTEVSWSFWSN
jgi:hypothetical protein